MYLVTVAGSQLADHLRQSRFASTCDVRKVFNFGGKFIPDITTFISKVGSFHVWLPLWPDSNIWVPWNFWCIVFSKIDILHNHLIWTWTTVAFENEVKMTSKRRVISLIVVIKAKCAIIYKLLAFWPKSNNKLILQDLFCRLIDLFRCFGDRKMFWYFFLRFLFRHSRRLYLHSWIISF